MTKADAIRVRRVERSQAAHFLTKARDFYQAMQWAASAGNWNSAGLAAVHCVIAAGDAALVKAAGLRSASEHHRDTLTLLKAHVKREGVIAAARHMEALLAIKSDIEYSEHELLETRALELVKHAERFLSWVASAKTSCRGWRNGLAFSRQPPSSDQSHQPQRRHHHTHLKTQWVEDHADDVRAGRHGHGAEQVVGAQQRRVVAIHRRAPAGVERLSDEQIAVGAGRHFKLKRVCRTISEGDNRRGIGNW